MDKREEQEKQSTDQYLNKTLNEQTNPRENPDLPNDEQNEMMDEPTDEWRSEPIVDETTDQQTDIYYQDEAVVAIGKEIEEVNESPKNKHDQAGFWIRFWAYMVDVIVVFSLNGIILTPVAFFRDAAIFDWQIISAAGVLSGIVYYLYFLLMTKLFQQTLGKMVMGIKVISTTNNQLAWGDLFFREIIGRFIYNVFFILKLLYLVVAFTHDKKGVHDIIGNTRVIHVP